MADIRAKYPSSSSVAVTITLASLATDSALLAGRESSAIDNTTNLDLDHLISGNIRLGTGTTASKSVEVWAFASIKTAAGVPTYPDVMDGTDSNETITSANVKAGYLRLVAAMTTEAGSGRDCPFGPVSIASLFGGMPKFYGIFVTHSSGVTLDSTAGNHFIEYERIQAQTV